MKKIYLLITLLLLNGFTKMPADPKIVASLAPFKFDIIAPAYPVPADNLDILKKLNSGFNLQLNILDKCFAAGKVLFFANTDQMRAECLMEALVSDNDNIIWAIRGGYGSARIIDYLSKMQKPHKEKTLIGYSDVTALHLFLSQEWGWKTIHGAVLKEIINPDKASDNFIKISKILHARKNEEAIKLSIDNLTPLNDLAKKAESLKGLLTGGNLTLVQNSVGTIWQIKSQNKIIFLEDVDIKPYQLDRMLIHLLQAGIFNEVRAIIFGSISGDETLIIRTLKDFAAQIKIPIYKTTQFGHNKFNYPLIYNAESEVESISGEKFRLIMYE